MPVIGNENDSQELQGFLLRSWKERWKPSSWAMKVKMLLAGKENGSKVLSGRFDQIGMRHYPSDI